MACAYRLPPADATAAAMHQHLPDPEVDWPAFETALRQRLSCQVEVRNLITMQYTPWINVAKLKKAYDPSCAMLKRNKSKENHSSKDNSTTSRGIGMILMAILFVILGMFMMFLPAIL